MNKGNRRWGVTTQAPKKITLSTLGGPHHCRVCGKRMAVVAPEPALKKHWTLLGISHEACGFWRSGELEARKACKTKGHKKVCLSPGCECVKGIAAP